MSVWELVGDEEGLVAGWLIDELIKWSNGSGYPYGNCVAAGVIARFWTSAGENSGQTVETALACAGPRGRAFAWFKRASEDLETVRRIVSHASGLQIWLRDERYELERAVESASGPKDYWRTANHAIRWLLERDQLESVHLMLSSAGLQDELQTLLRHLDQENRVPMEEVCRKIGGFKFEPGAGPPWLSLPVHSGSLPRHPHLFAVFCREPDSWWGAAAMGASAK